MPPPPPRQKKPAAVRKATKQQRQDPDDHRVFRRKATALFKRRRRCCSWARHAGIVFEVAVTVGLCMFFVLWSSFRPHLAVDVPGTTFFFTMFSNTHSGDSASRNKYGTTLAMVDHLDEKSVAFGQYSIGAHAVLVCMAWTCGRASSSSLFVHRDTYNRLLTTVAPKKTSRSNVFFRAFAVLVALGGMVLSVLFIDLADGYSTTGIKHTGGQTSYRSAGYRSDGAYVFQFLPLLFGLMLWVAF